MKYLLTFAILFICAAFAPDDTVTTRFNPPAGYKHAEVAPGSFADWLQHLPLMTPGTHTKTYKGAIAATDVFTAAVVDLSIGTEDLQQCADVVMRLRGEYLYQQKKYNDIAFHFESGFRCDYVHYADGYRYSNGHWVLKAKKDYGYKTFMRYMQLVFAYAGTLSLEKELQKVKNPDELTTGDVFIKGGSPGHCFIVMDVVENAQHKKLFLLAQSFMPAQNLQILQYRSPWFSMEQHSDIWYGDLIDKAYLKKFQD